MSKRYTLLASARMDLQEIIGYIAAENPSAARKLKALLMEACTKLADHLLMGQERLDLTTKPLRFWPVHRSYMVAYDPHSVPVRILRIYKHRAGYGAFSLVRDRVICE